MICCCCYQPMKFINFYFQDAKCKNCGIVLPKNTYIQACKKYKLDSKESSTYTLCVNCRLCPSRHNMRKVYDLKSQSLSLGSSYEDNQYSCDICNANKTIDSKVGILHCLACKYDICDICESQYSEDFERCVNR